MARGRLITEELRNRIIKLKTEGLSRPQIKERLGVSDWAITRTLKDSSKFVYKGVFNWSGEIITLYTSTNSTQRAMKNFSHQLAIRTGYSARYIREYFSPDTNNWGIEIVKGGKSEKGDK